LADRQARAGGPENQPGQAPGFCEQKSLNPPEPPEPVLVPLPDVPPPDVPPEVPDEPVPPVAAPVPPVAAPVPPVAAPVEPVPPVAAPVPEDDGVDVPLPAVPELVDDEVDGVVLDGVLEVAVSLGDVEDELSLAVRDAPPIEALSGAISSGAFFGTSSCVALLPPQALNPPVARSIKAMAVARRRTRRGSLSRRTAPSAAPSGGRMSGSR